MKIKWSFGTCYKFVQFRIRDLYRPFSYDEFTLKMKRWNCLLIAANPSITVTIFRKLFESSSDYAVKRLEVRETNLRFSVLAILADDSKMKLRGTRKGVTLMEVASSDFIFELFIQPRLLPFRYHRMRILDQKAYMQAKYKRDRRVIYSKDRGERESAVKDLFIRFFSDAIVTYHATFQCYRIIVHPKFPETRIRRKKRQSEILIELFAFTPFRILFSSLPFPLSRLNSKNIAQRVNRFV